MKVLFVIRYQWLLSSEYGGRDGNGMRMRSQVYRRHFSQNKRRVKEGKHLPVRSFHEYGAWEFEAAFKSKSEIYTWEKVWLTRWRGGSRLWRGRYWNVTEMGRQVSGPLKITNFYSSSVNIPWSSGISHKGRTEGLQQSSLFALLCCLLWKSVVTVKGEIWGSFRIKNALGIMENSRNHSCLFSFLFPHFGKHKNCGDIFKRLLMGKYHIHVMSQYIYTYTHATQC